MHFIVIPQCLLINGELEGYININNNIDINISNFTFSIYGYLFYKIDYEFKNDISYYIFNYNQNRTFSNFNNIQKSTINKKNIFSNNVINIKQDDLDPYNIIIKSIEQTYECKRMYFNTNKEFIIENEIITLPSFQVTYDTLINQIFI